MAFFQWKDGFYNPKQILKLIAVIVCMCIACYQLSECFRKLLHPPISTHYSFNLNSTLNFPAVTICRTSPYKASVFEKYGINSKGPAYTSSWQTFKYEEYTLEEFYTEATYSLEEILPFYGFDNYDTTVEIISSFLFDYGRCFTLIPNSETTNWDSDGYFLYLVHTDASKSVKQNGVSLAGFHIYIHDRRDVYTGNVENVGSFIDYVYGEVYEDIKLNLKVQVYEQLSTKDYYCNDSYSYSLSRCQQTCLQKRITEEIGCSAPWLPNPALSSCTDYNSTRALMMAYYGLNIEDYAKECGCPESCHLKVYTPYIHSIKEISLSNCYLAITFSSNLVTKMSEVLGYDWNLFLSDLGGSLGFLLGISVLGLVSMCEEFINILMCKKKKAAAEVDEESSQTDEGGSKKVENMKKEEVEGTENPERREHEEMKVYFKQRKMFEKAVAKNNNVSEYMDSNRSNNHTTYIQNKY